MSVSEFALGAMMFGAMGNTDHDESVRMIHAALDAGINFIDTADVYSGGESEEIVGKALKDRRDERGAGDQVRPADGRRPEPARRLAALDHSGPSRTACAGSAPTTSTSIRCTGRTRTPISTRLSPRCPIWSQSGKVRAIGRRRFPPSRSSRPSGWRSRRGHQRFRTEQPRYSILSRAIEGAVLPTAQRYGMGVLTYGPLGSGWLSGRADPTTGRRAGVATPPEFDLTVPANQVKLAAVEQLEKLAAEAGMPLTHMATAFVRAHPAVTSVLIGPRKPEQLADLLAGADVELGDDVLDRIDEIVAPGTELNPADNYFATPRAIEDKRLRAGVSRRAVYDGPMAGSAGDIVDRAEALIAVENAFAGYRGRYWIAGGRAVDLHVGRIRRVHSDVDVLILARDLELFDAVFGAGGITMHDHQTGTDTPWAFPQDVIPGRQVLRFADAVDPLAIEVVVGLADGDDWLFHRGRTTRRPLAAMTHVSPGGSPTSAPRSC